MSKYTCGVCGNGYDSPSLGGPGICPSCDIWGDTPPEVIKKLEAILGKEEE